MNFISKYFYNRRQRREEVKGALVALENMRVLQLKKEAELDLQLKQKEVDERLRMESNVPWHVLIGPEYDLESPPNTPISERHQWNRAFILSLREQGYRGETDTQVIESWEKKTATLRAQRLAEIVREERKNSDEPWVEVIGEDYDDDAKQVAVKLDWNKPFVRMLKASGYNGRTDEEIVNYWFKRLSEDISRDIREEGFAS